jgi:hypothetical protein
VFVTGTVAFKDVSKLQMKSSELFVDTVNEYFVEK